VAAAVAGSQYGAYRSPPERERQPAEL